MLVVINHIMEKELKVNLAGQIMIAIVKNAQIQIKYAKPLVYMENALHIQNAIQF